MKCPLCIKDCDFEKYILEKNACLEKVDGVFCLKRHHNYYFQVQQQLFNLTDRKHFVVCPISPDREPQLVKERIYSDLKHWGTVVPKLEAFWRVCILPEIDDGTQGNVPCPLTNPMTMGYAFVRLQGMTLSLLEVKQSVHMENFIHHVWLLAQL